MMNLTADQVTQFMCGHTVKVAAVVSDFENYGDDWPISGDEIARITRNAK